MQELNQEVCIKTKTKILTSEMLRNYKLDLTLILLPNINLIKYYFFYFFSCTKI